jgi:hypothetical protein
MAVVVLMAAACVASANLLVNGDFSLPGSGSYGAINTVSIPNWTSWGSDGWYAGDIGAQPSVKMWNSGTGIYQDWSATAGQAYNLAVQTYSASGEPITGTGSADLRVEWFNAGYTALGTTTLGSMHAGDPQNAWFNLSGTATAVVGAVYGRITLDMENAGGAAYFDNASVTVAAVPEPAAISMVGLGLVGLLHLRRRARA